MNITTTQHTFDKNSCSFSNYFFRDIGKISPGNDGEPISSVDYFPSAVLNDSLVINRKVRRETPPGDFLNSGSEATIPIKITLLKHLDITTLACFKMNARIRIQ
ncbi:MAG: hypothetical protein WHV60_03060 [Bacteroidota bacterium]